ncbi:MAG: ABC transporter ATP-binding protein [Albidovulum sp.]|nr:ABC transporter ATP-binding protein [Albidovulum sp.]
MAAFVAVEGLRKTFGQSWAVDDVNFEVEEGKLLVLLGPSGCGKTTTLRCVGGLEQPEHGRIVIDGEDVTNAAKGLFLQPNVRGMGMVAQSYAIWPHMNVFENVAFPLRMRKLGKSEISERVRKALNVVRLGELGGRNATDLSGGQQQRVALARAIVGRPKVLLFDEPLSNLDAKLREEMRYLLKDIQREIKITAIYVTHDQAEAMALGDELLVMNEGRIEQRGSAKSLYCEPRTRFVADFIGVANLLEGTLVGESANGEDTVEVKLGSGDASRILKVLRGSAETRSDVTILIRPEWVRILSGQPESENNVIRGFVDKCQYLGDRTEVLVNTEYLTMRAWIDGAAEFEDGQEIFMEIDAGKCIALPAN